MATDTSKHTNLLNKDISAKIKPHKLTDFIQIFKEEIITLQNKLNHRSWKVLNYKTPYEVFFEEFAKKLAAQLR